MHRGWLSFIDDSLRQVTLVGAMLLSISAYATGQTALDTSANVTATAAESEKSAGPIVRGLDLSSVPWTKSATELPDLYERDPDRPGKRRLRKNDIFPMPLLKSDAPSAWLKYPTSRGRFYVEYRDDRSKPETERVFGPIEGDPFEIFKLEEHISERLQSSGYAYDELYRIRLMLRTRHVKLVDRAFRLMNTALTGKAPLRVRVSHMDSIERNLTTYADVFAELELQSQVTKLKRSIIATKGELDRRTVRIPDEKYSRPEDLQSGELKPIPPRYWGKRVAGLRAAAVPATKSGKMGQQIELELVVRNFSDHEIRFSVADVQQSANAAAKGADGKKLQTRKVYRTGFSPLQRFALKPGERIVLAKPSIRFAKDTGDTKPIFGCTSIVTRPETIKVQYSFSLGWNTSWSRGEDGVMRRVSPGRGEWVGSLFSAHIPIEVTADE